MTARLRPARGVDVVITGGGTAGHVLPAVAVARALVAAGLDPARVRFVGARRGMEAHLVPAAGFRVALLPGRGIARRPSVANLVALAGLAVAALEALLLLASWRPAALVMVGGFAGAPASLAAFVLGVPIVVVNVDAVPGAANRLAARVAKVCAVALPGTAMRRAVVTGVPLRPEVLAARAGAGRAGARAMLGLPEDAAVVAVAGGSLGARRLNDATLGLPAELAAARRARSVVVPATVVYHVTGRRDHERVAASAPAAAGPCEGYRAVAFEEHMPELLVACDVFVSRAGASAVAEVCALGVASVLVPLPGAPADHQRRNAEVLAAQGAAVLLDDAACTPQLLAAVVDELLADPTRLASMRRAAAALGRPDAAARVAELVVRADAAAAADGREAGEPVSTLELDLGRPRRIHVVGVGGAGMSAVATVLVAMGHEVSGSDLKESAALARLRALGVEVAIGHDPANVAGAEALTISSAVDAANPEVLEARRRDIPVVARAGALAAIAAHRRLVAVAGTHGKTTTSSMLALALVGAGADPSFIIGGDVNEIGSNAVWGGGEWLVAEADESDGTFLVLDPELAVVTSVEPDHLEHYGSFEELRSSFARFLAGARGAVVCADDEVAASLAPPGATTYGFSEGATLRITRFSGGRSDIRFELERDGESLGELTLPVPGAYNARNATAAFAAATAIGASAEQVARRAGPLRRRGAPVRVPRRGAAASPSSTTTRTCRARSPPFSLRPAAAAGGGSSASSSRTATRGSRPCGRTSPTPSTAPTSSSSRRSTAPARPRARASRAGSWPTPWPRHTPSCVSTTSSAAPSSSATCTGTSSPGTAA